MADPGARANLRLNEAQWARILAQSGNMSAVLKPQATTEAKAGAATGSPVAEEKGKPQTPHVPTQQIAFLLALEGDRPNAKWSFWETALDALVQASQPAPAMTHAELLLPPEGPSDDMHFALYLGKQANWGRNFSGGRKFYLDPNGNGNSWRAVPIMGQDAVQRLREECVKHELTPYGPLSRLFNYPFSVPPLRSLAWMLDDTAGAPAHCASLVARCLRRALPELGLPNASGWYGPSTLYLELTRHSRMASYQKYTDEMQTLLSIPEREQASNGAETLLRGSDDSVAALSDADCQSGVDLLCKKCIAAAVQGDVTVERMQQRNLARALLRWSQVQRAPRAVAPAVSSSSADAAAPAPAPLLSSVAAAHTKGADEAGLPHDGFGDARHNLATDVHVFDACSCSSNGSISEEEPDGGSGMFRR